MNTTSARAASAALLLVAAAAARADLDVEIRNGDQVTGTLSPATAVEIVRFNVPQGAVLAVKCAAAKKGPQIHVRLRSPAGADLGDREGKSAAIAGVSATASGLYSVEVTSKDGVTTGDFTLVVSWKSRTSFTATPMLAAGGPGSLPFSAEAGATVTFLVKAAKSKAVPAVTTVTDPASASAAAGKKLVLSTTGDWSLQFEDTGAVGGAVAATAKIKPPKPSKRKLSLTSGVIGAGGDGDAAFSSVVGPAGGTVAAPLLPPGTPGAPISGSSVSVPAGSLPAGTAIIVATSPDLSAGGTTAGAGPTVFFGPEGLHFDTVDKAAKATVTIPFDKSLSGATATFEIYTRDAKGKVTLVPGPYAFDLVAGTVSFPSSHFSSFRAVLPKPAAGGNFPTIATITDPEDVCDALDMTESFPRTAYFVAEGGGATVGALRQTSATSPTLTHETWVGGGTSSADGTNRTQFQFVDPVRSVFALPGGVLYVATTTQIFKVDATGAVTRVAGTGQIADTGDNGPATSATFVKIRNIIADLNGGIFIADAGAHRIRYIAPATGNIVTWAGIGGPPGVGVDGVNPLSTQFVEPADLAFAPSGGLYVADGARIRLLNPFAGTGPVNVTVAGDSGGVTGSTGDGGSPAGARFQQIAGISQFIDPQNGNAQLLAVADAGDHTVRMLNFTTATVTLLAGAHGSAGFNGDNGSTPGQLSGPQAVVIGPGVVTVCDTGNQRVRSILGP